MSIIISVLNRKFFPLHAEMVCAECPIDRYIIIYLKGKSNQPQAQKGDPMETFIPFEKLSKKKQRELNAARRTTWALNPVTRKPANPKAYNRKTARNWKDDSNSVPFSIISS